MMRGSRALGMSLLPIIAYKPSPDLRGSQDFTKTGIAKYMCVVYEEIVQSCIFRWQISI